MAVKWNVEHTRGSVYLFDPADLVIKPELNGRHEAPDVEDLIQSILADGQLQPVMVRSENDRPVLVAGFSRWTAISEINKRKLTTERMKIACTYTRCNEQEGFIRNWQENRARNQTTPMDDAHHFAQLEKWGMDEKAIAAKLKIEPAFVKTRLALIEAEPEVQSAVASGRVKPTAAVRIAKLSAEQQRAIVKQNGHKISAKDVAQATGKTVKPSFKAVREYIEQFDGPGEEDETREVIRKILAFMDGK
jgi:ParB/RepB/Spo0J family partition protein